MILTEQQRLLGKKSPPTEEMTVKTGGYPPFARYLRFSRKTPREKTE